MQWVYDTFGLVLLRFFNMTLVTPMLGRVVLVTPFDLGTFTIGWYDQLVFACFSVSISLSRLMLMRLSSIDWLNESLSSIEIDDELLQLLPKLLRVDDDGPELFMTFNADLDTNFLSFDKADEVCFSVLTVSGVWYTNFDSYFKERNNISFWV